MLSLETLPTTPAPVREAWAAMEAENARLRRVEAAAAALVALDDARRPSLPQPMTRAMWRLSAALREDRHDA